MVYRRGGKTYERAAGSRAQVMHGTAHHTSGGLTKRDLKYNKYGRIVSRVKSEQGKRSMRRLRASGLSAEPFQ